jgi:DNA helicase HerA-like ATPase
MQVCGKTGSGKTVATKYLAQYFVEEMNGAVLAINVKDIDFLQMDRASNAINNQIIKEWGVLKTNAHPVNNFTIYYPANTNINSYRNINHDNCIAITLDVNSIEPDSLIGLLQNISDIAAQSLPDVFRFWKEEEASEGDTFLNFVNFFSSHSENPILPTLNVRGDRSEIPIHRSTFNNILRSLNSATEFFDNRTAVSINWQDILQRGQFSVINVTGEKGTQFGSIILRHLLRQIVRAKSQSESEVPILVIIDEVHQFYKTDASREALDELDTICRTGRSQKIGVIFSSQNQEDLPKGLTNVINTKIFFKSDGISKNLFNISTEEIQTLDKGFAVANIHDLPQLKVLKFPLSYAGVINS